MDNMKTLIGTRIKKEELEKIQQVVKDNTYVANLIEAKGTQVGEDEIKYSAEISYDMDVRKRKKKEFSLFFFAVFVLTASTEVDLFPNFGSN